MYNLKRAIIWLMRFRYRCGYGVHSPFAFDFITNVIYENAPYYAYCELERFPVKNKKINRLLFRLVNRVQPSVILDAGQCEISSLYLQAAKKNAQYISIPSYKEGNDLPACNPDFLYIHYESNPVLVKEIFENYVPGVHQHTVYVIQGIHWSVSMKTLWKEIVADERVGISFDLYDIGILFFDKSKIKQHYIVNF